jgi:hypothetical protein
MIKILCIGDLHGSSCWNEIKDKTNEYDKIIFVGDYVDSFTLSNIDIKSNLENLIEFKKQNIDKVVLLLGNHDMMYYFYPNFMCSGFRESYLHYIQKLFIDNENLFDVSFEINKYLFTHAGVTKSWYEKHRTLFYKYKKMYGINTISQFIKLLFLYNKNILMECGYVRGGHFLNGGPIWADYKEFNDKNLLYGYHQIVGHNPCKKIHSIVTGNKGNSSITFIDVIDYNKIDTKLISYLLEI